MRQHAGDLEKIRRYLHDGGFGDQERLPAERDLAAQLGLTRSRVRYCLRKLADEGLVWRHVGKGTYVGPRPSGLAGKLNLSLADITSPREIIEARLAIEPTLARHAALRGTNRQFFELEQCLAKFGIDGDSDYRESWDAQLHHLIAAAAGNHLMMALLDLIRSKATQTIFGELNNILHTPERMRESNRQHAEIVRAITARRADEAEEAMRQHLLSVQMKIFGPN
jgi:DNA-binding FadR family transcriptional regulator